MRRPERHGEELESFNGSELPRVESPPWVLAVEPRFLSYYSGSRAAWRSTTVTDLPVP